MAKLGYVLWHEYANAPIEVMANGHWNWQEGAKPTVFHDIPAALRAVGEIAYHHRMLLSNTNLREAHSTEPPPVVYKVIA